MKGVLSRSGRAVVGAAVRRAERHIEKGGWNKAISRAIELEHRARRARLLAELGSHGAGCLFQFPLFFAFPECVEMGDDVSFAAFVHIWGAGGVKFGDRIMVASHAAITSLTHDYMAPAMREAVVAAPVVIEDDVWIGTHAAILPGVTVGRGAVVGAGCVVTRDVPQDTIVMGVPGRVVGPRQGQKEHRGARA